jgi:hypothetical protein
MLTHHKLVDIFACLNLGYQPSSSFGKFPEKAFVPHLRVCVASPGPPAGTNTDEHPDVSPWPFVDNGLIQRFWGRVESSYSIIVKL